jgi:UDP-N-acetylglucosamine 2-epimerase (hydrolysing)
MKKTILFLTGTRADFGKLKPLIQVVGTSLDYEYKIFATGMHLLEKYGYTINEIKKSGFTNIFPYMNQVSSDDMEVVLANTINGLSRFLHESPVDLIVVHGDRVEALAGATVGALRNTLVAHVEGGEISGTVDELMRHAISKLSHVHFVATEAAKNRLIQLGEDQRAIFHIGSPDVDAMLSDDLPSLVEAKKRYDIDFCSFAIAMLHPVTTEDRCTQEKHAKIFVESLLESGQNYVVIYPNNDLGSDVIFRAYEKLENIKNIKIFPSLRFEHFLVLLKHSSFIIGNSSAGIHEAPVYAIPTLNLGSRQNNRFKYESIFDLAFDKGQILQAIEQLKSLQSFSPCKRYGSGGSAQKFKAALGELWSIQKQKQFKDIESENV